LGAIASGKKNLTIKRNGKPCVPVCKVSGTNTEEDAIKNYKERQAAHQKGGLGAIMAGITFDFDEAHLKVLASGKERARVYEKLKGALGLGDCKKSPASLYLENRLIEIGLTRNRGYTYWDNWMVGEEE
jgi:hypothetical protein